MNAASQNRLARLMPEFAAKIRTIVEQLEIRGFKVEITQGLRTFAEQDVLYSQGRTRKGPKVTNAKAGQSLHNYGIAADFALMVDDKYTWPDPHPVWKAIGEEAKKLGLEAGYYWKKPDKPHVEWDEVGWRQLLDRYKEGGIAKVWDSLRGIKSERPTLRCGDRGDGVKELQMKLSITADGIFGADTEKKVREFQASKGLTVDGIAGRATWAALG